jgi:ubiquinone/menaquinone biosynthesis C-methylase UbiE
MLSPFLKRVLSGYNEHRYCIAEGDYANILEANSHFEETNRLDLYAPAASEKQIALTLKAANISIPKAGRIVDLCCGTGYVARSLLSMNVVSSMIGIDLSEAQLDLLRQAVEKKPALQGRLSLLRGNALSLPFEDSSVDMIIGNSFLHHFPDVGAALIEAGRVLRPNGQFVVLHEPSISATFYESFPLSLFKDVVVENYTDLWQFEPDELTRLLYDAGFSKVDILTTGALSSVLLGAASIIVNKYFLCWTCGRAMLQYARAHLNALEYRLSWSRAPSLLIKAVK